MILVLEPESDIPWCLDTDTPYTFIYCPDKKSLTLTGSVDVRGSDGKFSNRGFGFNTLRFERQATTVYNILLNFENVQKFNKKVDSIIND